MRSVTISKQTQVKIMEGWVTYRHNRIKVNSLEDFANIRGVIRENSRDVSFIRILGTSPAYDSQVLQMDQKLHEQMQAGTLFYKRIDRLPGLSDTQDVSYYTACYEHWAAEHLRGIQTKVTMQLAGRGEEALEVQLGAACRKTLEQYLKGKAAVTESIRKNFAVKLLFWYDMVCSGMRQWGRDSCLKIVAQNVKKEQEYLFYYFLTLTGCDVLLLQSAGDLADDKNKALSMEVRAGDFSLEELPFAARIETAQQAAYRTERQAVQRADRQAPDRTDRQAAGDTNTDGQKKIVVRIPERNRKQHARYAPGQQQTAQGAGWAAQNPPRREKSFEELAALASSIVLILVHDQNGEVLGTGSGIMVGRGGYILTNDHVVRGGYTYSVRVENDDQVYRTDELIKYNPLLDLALLRIDRLLEPIPVYHGEKKLVRGQAVAAIGSPLGLFNSISDGIISGFRKIDGVDMIQFTAPISQGSSGGAVLNMYGEVIGISTAGFDRGQNINLAVGYESIQMFIQGF